NIVIPDSLCRRNNITDVTFYDSANVITNIDQVPSNGFPYLFIEKNRQIETDARAAIIKHLQPGQDMPLRQFHSDWVLGILLIAAFLLTIIRRSSKNIFSDFENFFLFKGISDPSSRYTGGFILWQSIILNLVSFFILALFVYSAGVYYNALPAAVNGILFWLISFGIIIVSIFLRYIICTVTGFASGQKELFRDYQQLIFQSYRLSALFLSVIIILIYYTVLPVSDVHFIVGFSILGVMYLIRIISLMIIFLNRNVSIFYLILYLCALEILPVLILVKYFTGLA
ncbi:MAG TPA: DUF4271 domain-containing protein, partial [Bacteroidales bacterium]|nr:DUF4271 domain-containing protein [Bacteroidales bacterium]